ncbi:hypothetical protein GGI03_007187 [Coemansia sp. RSA 2337]|nr:hypothetical protein GGH13_008786 [Coemansia sp. S155-1]KAJ2448710.1 hypothetical protein GGI03_007187 [Coemansia sp. RSA 2337]
MSAPQYAEKAPASSSSSATHPHHGAEEAVTLNVDPNTLTVADLYDKEKFDLETMDNKLVFQLLQCGPEGLTQAEAEARIHKVSMSNPLV